MTSLPHVPYANTATPLMSYLDDTFGAVGALTVIPCTANGANSITLSPVANTPTVSAYTTGAPIFAFNPNGDSTTSVTLQVNALGFLPVYLPDGVTQAGAGNLTSGIPVYVAYYAFLNSGAGGFIIVNTGAPPAVATGATTMRLVGGTWEVFSPSGAPISTAGSLSDGLQEAINYATNNGTNLYVIGGGTSRTQDFGIINCTSGISVPPIRTMAFIMDGVHVVFSAAVAGVGLLFDSIMECAVVLTGEVTYQGADSAVSFKPRNPIPVDTTTGVGPNLIRIGSVATISGTPAACVTFDATNGAINSNIFQFLELNGSGGVGSAAVAQFGVQVLAGASTGVNQNIIDIAGIHAVTQAAVQVGISSANQSRLNSNIWRIAQINPVGASSHGFDTFGSEDSVTIGSITNGAGSLQYGVYCQAGAAGNVISAGAISGASAGPFRDLGSNNLIVIGGVPYRKEAVYPTKTPTTINTAGAVTLTAAELTSGFIVREGSGGPFTDTTDTAANIVAAAPIKAVGAMFQCDYANVTGSTMTLGVGSGVSVSGLVTVPNATGVTMSFVLTNIGAGTESVNMLVA